MKQAIIAIILMLVVIGAACVLPGQLLSPHAGLLNVRGLLSGETAGSAPTATPFLPLPPTPTYLPAEDVSDDPGGEQTSDGEPVPEVSPTPGKAWDGYDGPSVWPDVEIPAPLGVLPHPEHQVNILILGSDQRPDDGGFRTDTIQLLTINPHEATAKLTSFPRDLYVYIPGYTVQRINTAFGWGGFDALAETMEYNFGVKPDYYVLTNFWSFEDVIDSLGGVTVQIEQDLCDHRNAMGEYCVYAGPMWMDGETALWYVRSRYSTSDIDRGRRQQEILEAMFDKLVSLDGLQRASDLYNLYQQNVTTDLTLSVLLRFLPVATKVAGGSEISRQSIGEDQAYDWITSSGAMVLVPVHDKVLEIMRQVISEP
ncbi:MAG: LCP family protein [Acidobacteriaceae bacterium]